ncbi:MAG: T9SS type A sorting domain-containing protein, partial [Bacteroidota bacterium]
KNFNLLIYDITGRVVYHDADHLTSTYFTRDVSLSGFAKGLYIVSLSTEKEKLTKKFVKL